MRMPKNIAAILATLGSALATLPAQAASPVFVNLGLTPPGYSVGIGYGPDASYRAVTTDIFGDQKYVPVDANGNVCVGGSALPCPQASGTGGSGGGAVTQGSGSTSNPWTVQFPQGTNQSVADTNSAAYQGVVALTPGSATPATPARGLGFICTAAGTLTLTLANGSTLAVPIAASAAFQTLSFGVTGIALSGGAAGTFWNLI